MKKPKSVDDYISNSPIKLQAKLQELRQTIKKAAPEAQEKISYSMPYYGYKGRLAYFRLSKNHIGLYIPGSVIEDYKNDLKTYETARATIRFPLNEKLPLNLIKKLIKARIKENDKSEIKSK